MKALESCWGEENMKLYTVEMKKAIAKCGHEDAPELNLPPFRSTYRFVNSMLNNANHMENQQYKLIEKMLEFMQGNQYNNYNRPSYNQYSRNDPEMNNHRSNSDSSMSRFFDMFKRNRVQRAANEDGA